MDAITKASGISRKGLHEAFGNHLKADALDDALAYLERSRLAYKRMVQPEGGGRPAERWYPVDGDSDTVDNHSPLSTVQPASPRVVQSDSRQDVCADACELTNKLPQEEGELVRSFADAANKLPQAVTELVRSFADGGTNEAKAEGELVVSFPCFRRTTGDSKADGERGEGEKVVVNCTALPQADAQSAALTVQERMARQHAIPHSGEPLSPEDKAFIAELDALPDDDGVPLIDRVRLADAFR